MLGAWGVTINVWWGAVELSPGSYDWAPLASVINIAEDVGLRVKVRRLSMQVLQQDLH